MKLLPHACCAIPFCTQSTHFEAVCSPYAAQRDPPIQVEWVVEVRAQTRNATAPSWTLGLTGRLSSCWNWEKRPAGPGPHHPSFIPAVTSSISNSSGLALRNHLQAAQAPFPAERLIGN